LGRPSEVLDSGSLRIICSESIVVAGKRIKRKQTGLSSDKVARGKGWHSREVKPKDSKVKKVT
jgi:hypothetical protein